MRFFISSTFEDLKEIRKIAINFFTNIVGSGSNSTGTVVAMEFFDASERYCIEQCLHELSTCDLLIGIYGDRYGTRAEDGRSITEVELDYAVAHGIPVLAFVKRQENREELQEKFIADKVYGRNKSCANFEGGFDFAERLNSSLKSYLGEVDGYSNDSLWDEVSTIREKICKELEAKLPASDLQMIPYGPNDEDLALNQIILSASNIKGYIESLGRENHILHEYAYMANHYPSSINEHENKELCQRVRDSSETILANWGLIHLGLNNCTTAIILASSYLKLKRMQQRLLTERWTESLRQEVIKIRNEYIDTIPESHYID